MRRASAVGVFALAFFFDPLGRWLPPSGPLAQYYLAEDLDSIGGSGWIPVGNYDMASYRWTAGPFYQSEKLDRDNNHSFPWTGDTIRLKNPERLIILDWQTARAKRYLSSPSERTQIRESDFTPIGIPAGGIVEIVDVRWSQPRENSVTVWARVTAPQAGI